MFVDEIRQQPGALRDAVEYYRSGEGWAALDRLSTLGREAAVQSRGSGPVVFTGMGSSFYAADVAQPRLSAAGIDARTWEAGEWLHYGPPEPPAGTLVVAVSQSGESIETRALAERLAGRTPLVAVTNEPASRLARAADVVLPMRAGHEEMISTKTYTNTLGVLHLAAGALLGETLDTAVSALLTAAEAMEQALSPELEPLIRQAAEWLDEAGARHAIARGPCLATARGGALILGEGAHLAVTALPAASFRHGPMELAGAGHAALLVVPASPTRALMERLIEDLVRAGSRVVAFVDGPLPVQDSKLVSIGIGRGLDESLFPLPAAIVVERLLAVVAERRGLIPGQFQYGGKITDQE
jgi:glutamine---fructose-6-phosphate transaminase (isomerizing)